MITKSRVDCIWDLWSVHNTNSCIEVPQDSKKCTAILKDWIIDNKRRFQLERQTRKQAKLGNITMDCYIDKDKAAAVGGQDLALDIKVSNWNKKFYN